MCLISKVLTLALALALTGCATSTFKVKYNRETGEMSGKRTDKVFGKAMAGMTRKANGNITKTEEKLIILFGGESGFQAETSLEGVDEIISRVTEGIIRGLK